MGVPWSLYAAHTLSTWGDNMWWFAGAVPLIMMVYSNPRIRLSLRPSVSVTKRPHLTHYPQANTLSNGWIVFFPLYSVLTLG